MGLAKSLELLSVDTIETSNQQIESFWYKSKGPADLFFWKKEDRIIKHQVTLYNQVVEWNIFDGVKTGYIDDDRQPGQGETILFDHEVNDQVLSQAIEFLDQVSAIDSATVHELKRNFRFYGRWNHPGWLTSLSNFLDRLVQRFFLK